MDNNFLLTYDCCYVVSNDFTQSKVSKIISTYSWFESEEEMRDFVDEIKNKDGHFKVNEAIEIKDDRQINFGM